MKIFASNEVIAKLNKLIGKKLYLSINDVSIIGSLKTTGSEIFFISNNESDLDAMFTIREGSGYTFFTKEGVNKDGINVWIEKVKRGDTGVQEKAER